LYQNTGRYKNHMVFERTWLHAESWMHMLIPTLLLEVEKEASTLHLSLPLLRFLHIASPYMLFVFWPTWVWGPVFEGDCTGPERPYFRLAFLQHSRRCFALSKIVTVDSDTCSHSFRLRDFQILHIIVTTFSTWLADNFCNRLNIMSGALSNWFRDGAIKCQTLAAFQTSMAVLQWKNMW